jgi:tRNA(Ile2) C34 agmatinyltransferase TiaS
LRISLCGRNRAKETKMKKTKTFAAITIILTSLASASLFAEERHRQTTDDWRGRTYESRRVTIEGRIRDIDRNRNEFVIRLDRGNQTLLAPGHLRIETVSRRRGRTSVNQLERGDVVRATGTVDRRGFLNVDRITMVAEEDDRHDSNDRYLTGIVESVDRRGEVVFVQVQRSARVVAVDMRHVDRNNIGRDDARNLRRGDRITVRGDWRRNGRFEAERIDVDRRW